MFHAAKFWECVLHNIIVATVDWVALGKWQGSDKSELSVHECALNTYDSLTSELLHMSHVMSPSQEPCKINPIIIPIFTSEEVREREVTELVLSHTDSEGQSSCLNLGNLVGLKKICLS